MLGKGGGGGAPKKRRQRHAEDSRRALLTAARSAFAERGYAQTSLDDIVAAAGLTKGALYHHFESKTALFEALYIEMAGEVAEQVLSAVASKETPWTRMLAAIEAFFDASAVPDYVRIVLREAPSVLGAEQGRKLDQAIGLSLVESLLSDLASQGLLSRLPLEATARILLAAVSEVAVTMADAGDPTRVRADGTKVIVALLKGLDPRTRASPG